MIDGPYFRYTMNTGLDAKFMEPTWQRTTGVENALCELLNESRDKTIMFSEVRQLTRWPKDDIKLWLSILYSRRVLVSYPYHHANRYCLAYDFPSDRDSLLKLIPEVGSTILPEKQACWREKTVNQLVSTSDSKASLGDRTSNLLSHVNPTVDYVYPGYA
jgi:hypothetical protein